jgi:hypothetical protein
MILKVTASQYQDQEAKLRNEIARQKDQNIISLNNLENGFGTHEGETA